MLIEPTEIDPVPKLYVARSAAGAVVRTNFTAIDISARFGDARSLRDFEVIAPIQATKRRGAACVTLQFNRFLLAVNLLNL